MKRWSSAHPVLLALFPVVALLELNLGEIDPSLAVRSLFVAAALALLSVWVLNLAIKDWARARLIAAGWILALFTYGHIYELVKNAAVGGFVVGRHRYLVVLVLGAVGLWAWWVLRRMRNPQPVERFLGAVGVIALAIPASFMAYWALTASRVNPSAPSPASGPAGSPDPSITTPQPDIYYIIVDAYARQDVLLDLYGHDNREFVDYLEGRGFYVALDAQSNYMTTLLSLASSLNLEYLDEVLGRTGGGSEALHALREMLDHSLARSFLSAHGYKMVTFESGWTSTDVEDADIYLKPGPAGPEAGSPPWELNEFEVLLLRSTLARPALDVLQSRLPPQDTLFRWPFVRHRQRIRFAAQAAQEIPAWPGDYFVFVHLIIPHPPFVFGPNGESVQNGFEFSFRDGNAYEGSREEYLQGYRDQVIYANHLLMDLIDQLLDRSDVPPIIILQGDHGPRSRLVWAHPHDSDLRETFSILSAYYFPEGRTRALYPSVTPVNSFRILFDTFFNTDYGTLADESYFNDPGSPMGLFRVPSSLPSYGGAGAGNVGTAW